MECLLTWVTESFETAPHSIAVHIIPVTSNIISDPTMIVNCVWMGCVRKWLVLVWPLQQTITGVR